MPGHVLQPPPLPPCPASPHPPGPSVARLHQPFLPQRCKAASAFSIPTIREEPLTIIYCLSQSQSPARRTWPLCRKLNQRVGRMDSTGLRVSARFHFVGRHPDNEKHYGIAVASPSRVSAKCPHLLRPFNPVPPQLRRLLPQQPRRNSTLTATSNGHATSCSNRQKCR